MSSTSILDRFLANVARLHARTTTQRFFRAVDRATRTQDRLLFEILSASSDSDYARNHGLSSARTYRDYADRVPIQTYADLAPYIDRVRSGVVRALFSPGERILMFALTSGTTAQSKYIPITQRALADCRAGWNIWGLKAILDHDGCLLRHIVQVTSPMNDHAAPSGVPCGAITGMLAATQKKLVRKYYTSPLSIAGIADTTAKYYTIMRLAVPNDVAWLVTANPATLLALARNADENREALIRDIRDGTLNPTMNVEPQIRNALAPRLSPDPARARNLEKIVQRTGRLLPKDYWRLGFLAHWTGGTMGLYRSQFPALFGNVPARDIGLIASEGRMSIPLEDSTASGVLAVTSQFFEFIPADEYGTAKPTVLRCHELSEGGEYFLLLTNFSGLFRYDLGDRVRVTGRMGQAPMIEFLSRDAHTASMAGEKLTEDQVVMAMQSAAGNEASITNFVLAPRWADIPFYRLYVEMNASKDAKDLAKKLDRALGEINIEYESKRKSLRLGPVDVVTLPTNRLTERNRELRAKRARTAEQFKHQYLLPQPGLDADLDAARSMQEA
ncbi:MAG: GH3 auxin-responsive promoter family protein [Planctomycetes bacterium]|nr:GH3 auxin-responsive promoter family protein [Planctomycetota bacterium]